MALPEGTSLVRLSEDHAILPFDCGDSDLNEFLLEDSKAYQKNLLAVTYIIQNSERTIAYFSVLNDSLRFNENVSKNRWKRVIGDLLHFEKRSWDNYPAAKIGRLAVHLDFQSTGIGRGILDYIKQFFIEKNKTGCRFLTVDAYNQSLQFYERNDFQYMTPEDEGEETRQMFFDLARLTVE